MLGKVKWFNSKKDMDLSHRRRQGHFCTFQRNSN